MTNKKNTKQETIARDELAAILETQPRDGIGNYVRGILLGVFIGCASYWALSDRTIPFLNKKEPGPVTNTAQYEQALQTLYRRVDNLAQRIETPLSYAALADSIRNYIPERTITERTSYFDESAVVSVVQNELRNAVELQRASSDLRTLQAQVAGVERELVVFRRQAQEISPVASSSTRTRSGQECIEAVLYNHERERQRYNGGKDVLLCTHPEGQR